MSCREDKNYHSLRYTYLNSQFLITFSSRIIDLLQQNFYTTKKTCKVVLVNKKLIICNSIMKLRDGHEFANKTNDRHVRPLSLYETGCYNIIRQLSVVLNNNKKKK